ncbi:MAG: type IV toxin-antitoxin system AbiEi family antitoxin [Paracoccaceae bacterium]|nr:type IV toxin-antitoxin system AbiEi family antitoxin [Paracoccaceae bacterium]
MFDNVYIEKSTPTKPKAETRALKSLFSPKAGVILRVLLKNPSYAWRMTNLAAEARASLGHVSNVRKKLLDREWIEIRKEGIILIQPDSLLKSWRENYQQPSGEIFRGYTTLHGDQLINQLTGALGIEQESSLAILSSNSAAQWLAPYLRDFTQTFYANKFGADILEKKLDLKRTESGANVIIHILKDDCYFDGAIQPKPGIYCTDPILTYLDLWNGNDRSREAADFLAGKYFPWH